MLDSSSGCFTNILWNYILSTCIDNADDIYCTQPDMDLDSSCVPFTLNQPDDLTWNDANDYCDAVCSTDLFCLTDTLNVTNTEFEAYVRYLLQTNGFNTLWLGIHDQTNEAYFECADIVDMGLQSFKI